ncbi:malonate decarboxylase holo-ACP synthase [Priestia filamentosa]|uniref:malonate decarboxylase holo-ACP synthase n=1 Tax=Priestia filamentosa TaxID=1402861 RepID=UPI003D2BB420
MELKPHDLIKLSSLRDGFLAEENELPQWAQHSLQASPYVVVRRAPFRGEYIPVGVRGKKRSERFGLYISKSVISKVISPIQLQESFPSKERQHLKAFQTLKQVRELLQTEERWGLGGSVGFELATGVQTVKETSDVDVILYKEDVVNIKKARELLAYLDDLQSRVDISVETKFGSFSLMEYCSKESFLLKTIEGPKLIQKPFFP